jgi:predicted nucleotidyltransferase component of viral defense system
MRPDRELVERVAAERGFSAGPVEKALCLLDLLGEIVRHRYLEPRLVLKGGTALNLFHWECPRLSVDIDLNYVGGVSSEEMQGERDELLQTIERIAESMGYVVQRGRDAHAGRTMYLRDSNKTHATRS